MGWGIHDSCLAGGEDCQRVHCIPDGCFDHLQRTFTCKEISQESCILLETLSLNRKEAYACGTLPIGTNDEEQRKKYEICFRKLQSNFKKSIR